MTRRGVLTFLAGAATPPALTVLVGTWVHVTTPGTEWTCTVCGYRTGPRRETTLAVAWLRWKRHVHWDRRRGDCVPEPTW